MAPQDELYDPRFVCALFDEMAATYGTMNLLTSFGFTVRWRRQCVEAIPFAADAVVYDLMTGMGELVEHLAGRLGPRGRVVGLDLSPVMCARARETMTRVGCSGEVVQADALEGELPWGSADAVVSSFGLKTFSPAQQAALAGRLARLLKPGGRFSFLEISVPANPLLRLPYLGYLCGVVPWLGRVLLGNPDNYRLLGVYTTAFGDASHFVDACRAAGLECELVPYFFGCATAAVGRRP